MRWVFFGLLILNVVYLGWKLLGQVAPPALPSAHVAVPAQQQLQLLSEASAAAVTSAPNRPLCVVVGPWPSLRDGEEWRGRLRGVMGDGEVRPVAVRKDRLSWVYLPPTGRREAAMQMLRELQSRGVDSFIVAEGEDATAISLGYFSSAESARGLQVKMRNAGYAAEVRETSKEVTEYWLFYSSPNEAQLAQARSETAGAGVEISRAACASY